MSVHGLTAFFKKREAFFKKRVVFGLKNLC